MNKWTKAVLIIIVVAIIIWFLLDIKVPPEIDGEIVPFESIKDQMKTGDVISMHSSYLLKRLIMRGYLGCQAVHVGMIVRVQEGKIDSREEIVESLKVTSQMPPKGKLYVLEIGPYGKWPFRRSDVRFTPLEDVMKYSSHDVFGWTPVDREIPFSAEDLRHYSDMRYNYLIPTMFSPYKKYKVCSSFVAKIHEDKGIGRNHHVRSPCDYYDDPRTIMFRR